MWMAVQLRPVGPNPLRQHWKVGAFWALNVPCGLLNARFTGDGSGDSSIEDFRLFDQYVY